MESERNGEKEFYIRAERFEHVIYDAGNDNRESKKDTPQIIEEINEYFKSVPHEDLKFSVEGMAEGFGINKKILYEWVKTDMEFSTTLERFKNIQENDPFKTDTVEDVQVSSMLMALILMETRDRHQK
jgi:DNA-packaging protein gp3